MKTTIKLLSMFAILTACVNIAYAQNTKKEKQAVREADMKKALDAKTYTFTAQSANPMRGGNMQLTSEYDFKVRPDTIIAYLPYFGRAYVAPIDPSDGGIKFTSTNFEYTVKEQKNGNRDIIIKPRDTKDVRQLVLNVSLNGYATLSINNTNRDPISFYGIVTDNKKDK